MLPNSLTGVVSISVTAPNDHRSFFSNYGTNEIDVSASGGGYETQDKTVDLNVDVEWPYPLKVESAIQQGAESDRSRGDYKFVSGRTNALNTVERLL